jgi:predicted Co/Zn/Cd cation transporter (cation efflux family)
MPQNKTEEILKKLTSIEKKIDYNGLSSIKLVLFSIGFGFLISSITVIFQSPKIFSLFSFIMGVILIIWAFFLGGQKRKS